MKVFKAPEPVVPKFNSLLIQIFLAGSIEMGKAVDWQAEVTETFRDDDDVYILNPRRDDWDSSWTQSIDNEQFRTQVEWELEGLNNADIVFMYFAPGTQSPITLLEFGLMVSHLGHRLVVVCPEGFWRRGNLEVTCAYWDVPLYDNVEDGLVATRTLMERFRS